MDPPPATDPLTQLSAAIESGQACLFVGAGLSQGSDLPSWGNLVKPFREEFGLPETFVDYTKLAQYIENQDGGRERLVSHVCAAIGGAPHEPTENHHLIAVLPVADIWTTNYDTLIESAMDGVDAIEVDDDFLTFSGDRRVYKMHGSIRHGDVEPRGGPERLVLSRADFERYSRTHPRFWKLLQAQFLTKSFLFLGFSMADPNFEAMVSMARLTTPERFVPHYAILRRDQSDSTYDLKALDLESAGIHVIEVAEYEEVTELLRQLVVRTRPAGLMISGSEPGDRPPPAEPSAAYPTAAALSDDLASLATKVGSALAARGVSVLGGGDVAATVGYALLAELGDAYDPARFRLLRRARSENLDPPSLRLGSIIFTGTDPGELRDSVFEHVRAIAVLGGGQGTLDEVGRARANGMGVVPIACTGGTARIVWEEMMADEAAQLGGQTLDRELFALLGSDDSDEAVEAAVRLIDRALYRA